MPSHSHRNSSTLNRLRDRPSEHSVQTVNLNHRNRAAEGGGRGKVRETWLQKQAKHIIHDFADPRFFPDVKTN